MHTHESLRKQRNLRNIQRRGPSPQPQSVKEREISEMRKTFQSENLKWKDNWQDNGEDDRIISNKLGVRTCVEKKKSSTQGQVAGTDEWGNRPSG